jgi:hypothetical protein
MPRPDDLERLPDVRDGLTRLERIILWQIEVVRTELGREDVPTAMLYGRVVEHINVPVNEFLTVLARMTGRSW